MASNIGTAYVQIVPAATGISQKMSAAIAPGAASAGVTAGQKIAGSIGATMKKVGGGMMKAGAIATAVSVPIIAGIKKALEAYGIQNAAETKLTEIYKTRMGLTDKAAKSTIAYAAALQKEGVVGDEVMLSGAQQLATFASTNKTVESLLPAMNNLMVQQKGLNGTQQDATNIANLMGKVLTGQTGALKRVGISFTEEQEAILKTGNEEERAAMLAQVITDNVGDMNKAMLNTPEGRMKQLSNTLGDIKEEIGRAFVPILADVATFLQKRILPVVSNIVKVLQGNKTLAKVILAVTAVLAIGGPLLVILGAIVSSVGALLPVIGAISAPMLAVAAAIGAVIAALVTAYIKSEAFRKAVNELVKSVVSKMSPAIKAGGSLLKTLCKEVMSVAKAIGSALAPVIKLVTPLVSFLAKIFATKLTIAFKVAEAEIKAVGAVIRAVAGIIKSVAQGMAGPLQKAAKTVTGAVKTIKGLFPLKLGKIFSGIKLPHFKISGGKIPWGIGGMGKKPTVDIDWYAKGGIFDSPNVIGVGESTKEAAIPLEGRHMRPFAKTIAEEMGNAGTTYNIGDVTLDLKDLKDIVTLEQLVAVIKRAKAMA